MESIAWVSPSPDAQCLTVITARGGSKGLPGKNVQKFVGKPLIAWTIEAARGAKLGQHIIVSTDDMGIASVAAQHGASVPFLRPAELATDNSSSEAAVLHAIDFFVRSGFRFPYVMLLQPTSPLRTAKDIDDAFAFMKCSSAPSCVSVCKNEHSAYNLFFLNENNTLSYVLPPQKTARRQDHPKTYRANGAIYIVETEWFLKNKTFIGVETVAFIMPDERSVDIDNAMDFTIAAAMLDSFSAVR
jgi:CMP-N-acetylneuraminic acid synthetase